MIMDMTSDELRHIARKLTTYANIYTGDKEARQMAARCVEIADLLDAATARMRDLTVARVDENGVAYNAAGESIGITGTMGDS